MLRPRASNVAHRHSERRPESCCVLGRMLRFAQHDAQRFILAVVAGRRRFPCGTGYQPVPGRFSAPPGAERFWMAAEDVARRGGLAAERSDGVRSPPGGLSVQCLRDGSRGAAVARDAGGVPKWTKGTVCKTVIRGFESRRRLSISLRFTRPLQARRARSPWDGYQTAGMSRRRNCQSPTVQETTATATNTSRAYAGITPERTIGSGW